jgi:hypothetical protein
VLVVETTLAARVVLSKSYAMSIAINFDVAVDENGAAGERLGLQTGGYAGVGGRCRGRRRDRIESTVLVHVGV